MANASPHAALLLTKFAPTFARFLNTHAFLHVTAEQKAKL